MGDNFVTTEPWPPPNPLVYRIISWILLFSHIATFSILGTIIRMVLIMAQSSLPKNLFFESYVANIVGCFIMGILFEFFASYDPTIQNVYHKAGVERLYIGLTTGLCGSITTFSQWQQDSNLDLSRGLVGSFFVKQAQGIVFSFSAYHIGRHCYLFVYHGVVKVKDLLINAVNRHRGVTLGKSPREREDNPVIQLTSTENETKTPLTSFYASLKEPRVITIGILEFMLLGICLCTIICVIVFSIIPTYVQLFTIPLIFSPVGAIMRFLVLKLNGKAKLKIPIFTILVNVSGSIVYCILFHIALRSSPQGAMWMTAMGTGLCGCFTTVSSMIQDIHVVKTLRYKYIYYALSMIFTIVPLVIINVCFLYT